MPIAIIQRKRDNQGTRIVDTLDQGAIVKEANLTVIAACRHIWIIESALVAPGIKSEAENPCGRGVFRSERGPPNPAADAIVGSIGIGEGKAIGTGSNWRLNPK